MAVLVFGKRLAYVPGESNLWGALSGKQTLDLLGALHGAEDLIYRKELVERFQVDPTKRGSARIQKEIGKN